MRFFFLGTFSRRYRFNNMRLFSLLFLAIPAFAQTGLSGQWAITLYDEFGKPEIRRLLLKEDGEKLTGSIGSQSFEGSAKGLDLSIKLGNVELKGRLIDGQLEGDATQGERRAKWKAVRLPDGRRQPRTHTFEPAQFELYFTSSAKPVL